MATKLPFPAAKGERAVPPPNQPGRCAILPLLEKEFLGAANKEMHLVQDVNQVLTELVVYMINERVNYEYRITY